MNRQNIEAWYRVGVSILVLAILGVQASTLLVTASGRTIIRNKLFPILEYPMYGIAHYEGERVTGTWFLEGVYPDGRKINLTKETLQLSTWDFVRIVQHTLRGLPGAQATFQETIRLRAPDGDSLRAVRIYSYPIKVTRHGPHKIPSETAMTIVMQPAATGAP